MLVVLCIAYGWIALRTDGRMRTIPFLPYWLTYHLEFYTMSRNALAFGLLAIFGAGAVTGLHGKWYALSLGLCLAAPWVKDSAQLFVHTRHFNWTATAWGVSGALAGWILASLLFSRFARGN